MEKRPFFRADMAGLGKYCMGGYGRIGVYRVNIDHMYLHHLRQFEGTYSRSFYDKNCETVM